MLGKTGGLQTEVDTRLPVIKQRRTLGPKKRAFRIHRAWHREDGSQQDQPSLPPGPVHAGGL
jgi:hypothetical protein